jgi:hypothetical protein
MTRRPPSTPGTRGGRRAGAGNRSLFPGKKENNVVLGHRLRALVTPVAYAALMEKRDALSAHHGHAVSVNDSIEWCIRKATRTSLEV